MKTICHAVLGMRERKGPQPAIRHHRDHHWVDVSWPEYFATIEGFAAFLLEQGVQPGERVAILSYTRFEWAVSDYACMGIHAIVVPIYQSATASEIEYILKDSEARVLLIEGPALLKKWGPISANCPSVRTVIAFDAPGAENPGILTFGDALARGREKASQQPGSFEKLLAAAEPSETATIVYTSGTTGSPKGVVITHDQIVSEVTETFPAMGITPADVSLSFLPYAHVLGRVEHWGNVFVGFTLAFAQSIEKIRPNMLEIRPTILMAVPRIFEKIYSTLLAKVTDHKVQRFILELAHQEAILHSKRHAEGRKATLFEGLRYQLVQALALKKIRAALGGRLRLAVLGGAALNREIAEFFHGAGVLLMEGYGLTETTAAICMNTPTHYRFGTVGRPLKDVRLRIAEDGEILIKSRKVMKEYYKNPEATAEVLRDGWFSTGDIGELTPLGDLRITDRKKDLIKTAGAKYVAPQKLEGMLIQNPYVSHALIHGDGEKYIVALLTLNAHELRAFARKHQLDASNAAALAKHPKVHELCKEIVDKANSMLADFEKIRRFGILPQEFTVEAGELTANLKLKRKFCVKKYHGELKALYH